MVKSLQIQVIAHGDSTPIINFSHTTSTARILNTVNKKAKKPEFVREKIQTRATTAKKNMRVTSNDDFPIGVQTRATTAKKKKVTFVSTVAKNKIRRSLMFASTEDVRN